MSVDMYPQEVIDAMLDEQIKNAFDERFLNASKTQEEDFIEDIRNYGIVIAIHNFLAEKQRHE